MIAGAPAGLLRLMGSADGAIVQADGNVKATIRSNVALNLIACNRAAYCSSDGGQFATFTATYLVTQQATYDGAAGSSHSTTLAAGIDFIDCINNAAIRAYRRTGRRDIFIWMSVMDRRGPVIRGIAGLLHRRLRGRGSRGLAVSARCQLRVFPGGGRQPPHDSGGPQARNQHYRDSGNDD